MRHKENAGARIAFAILVFISALAMPAHAAHATVTISSAATKNMSCAGGVCTPAAKKAVLNVTDLESLLANGNVAVNTAGATASDIDIKAALSWVSANGLTLDAYRSITVEKPISDAGPGSLSLRTNDGGSGDGGSGGTLTFTANGSISFLGTSNALTINDNAYTLENSISTLASNIAANPSGFYALSNSYDASHDGIYPEAPIPTIFTGRFEGLGNTITALSVNDGSSQQLVGLFAEIGTSGAAADLRLLHTSVSAVGIGSWIGSFVGFNEGTISAISVSGSVKGGKSSNTGGLTGLSRGTVANCSSSASVKAAKLPYSIGGLVGFSQGAVMNSSATGSVTVGKGGLGGGLVGENDNVIDASFATGAVTGGSRAWLGGLVGFAENETGATISNSYATGAVSGGTGSLVGGLLGRSEFDRQQGTITGSYSTGAVTGGTAGGLIGYDDTGGNCGCFTDLYWDTTTSGITNLSQGAGNVPNDPGITGETTTQLQAGLPVGFDPKVWAEKPNINGGLPYLIANPPPQ